MGFCHCPACMENYDKLLKVLDAANIGMFDHNPSGLAVAYEGDAEDLAKWLEKAKEAIVTKEKHDLLKTRMLCTFGFPKDYYSPFIAINKVKEKIDGLEYNQEQLEKQLEIAEGALKALRFDRDAIMTVSGLLPAEECENEETLMRALEITAKRLGTITERLSEVRARKAEKP